MIAPYVFADTIKGSNNSNWQIWSDTNLDGDGKPYWDHKSSDHYNGDYRTNIGYYLTKTGAFESWPDYEHPGAIPFWGKNYISKTDSSGNFDKDFYFIRDSLSSHFSLRLELADYANFNSFGYYDVSDGKLHEIFTGADSKGTAAILTPTDEYGFYLINKTGDTFLTQSGRFETEDKNFQHFAVFKENSDIYWVGVEDLLRGGDKDYNDLVIKVTAVSPVPEPATMFLLGSGLIGLAGFVRRKFKR
jgi:hypothetical protein